MRLTIQDISIEQYQKMNEDEKQAFYKEVFDSQPQCNIKKDNIMVETSKYLLK